MLKAARGGLTALAMHCLVALAHVSLLFSPQQLLAGVSLTNSQCPDPNGCNNSAGSSPLWPGVGNFSICNTSIAPWTLKGIRWKTADFNGYTTYGGPPVQITGSGPYQYEQPIASTEQVLRAAYCLNSYSLGNPVAAFKNGQPYDYDVLIKNGSCSPVEPFPTPTPMTCAEVVTASNQAAFYDSSLCITNYLGKNGGADSGGLINTFYGQTQIQLAIPAAGWAVNTDPIIWDPVVGMGNSPMYLMANAAGQEYLNVDMMFLAGIGSKESKAANIMGGTPLFIPTNAAGVAGTYHVEDTTFVAIVGAYPGFFPDYACVATYPNVTTALGTACAPSASTVLYFYMSQSGFTAPYLSNNSAQLVNSVFAVSMNMYRLYDSLLASTDLCFKKLLEDGSDPWAAIKMLPGGYNQGINSGYHNSLPPSAGMLAATDITSYTNPGNSNYRDDVLRTATNLSNASASCPHSSGVFDAPISQADLQTFFFGNGGTVGLQGDGGLLRQFAITTAERNALWTDVLCAFNALKGRAPTAGVTATNNISYRYDFLSILRVARQYFRLQRPYPTQTDFSDWVTAHSTTDGSACGITSDTSFPYINNLLPAQDSTVCPDFLVSFSATDNVGVSSVEFSLDPDWLAWSPATSGGGGNYSFNAPGSDSNFPSSGAGELWVRVTDACGNQTVRQLDFMVSCGTPTPTRTPTRTATPSPTRTPSPSPSPTRSVTYSPTPSPSPSVSPSFSPTRSVTSSITPTVTPSVSPSPSGTVSPTRSATPTASASPSPGDTPSYTQTATLSASPTVSMTRTVSPSPSVSSTATPTSTPTLSPSPTRTVSPTPSVTLSWTQSPVHTPTVSPTASPTFTPSRTFTATRTSTRTASPTVTPSPSPTGSLTRTVTRSSTPTPTQSMTRTATPYLSPTPSSTITPTFSETASPAPWVQQKLILVKAIYPNPFVDRAYIYYTLREDAEVTLSIYNVAGEIIRIERATAKTGKNLLTWDGVNSDGSRCASGVYVLRFKGKGVDGVEEDFWENAVIAR